MIALVKMFRVGVQASGCLRQSWEALFNIKESRVIGYLMAERSVDTMQKNWLNMATVYVSAELKTVCRYKQLASN